MVNIMARTYRTYDQNDFYLDVCTIDWSDMYDVSNVNEALVLLKHKLLPIIEKHAAWVTNELLSYIDKHIYRYAKFAKNRSEENFTLKKQAMKCVTQLKQCLQHAYIKGQIEECRGDSRKLWKCVKSFWPTKNKQTQIQCINGKCGDKEISEELNQYFWHQACGEYRN